jgi:phage gp36-like protein
MTYATLAQLTDRFGAAMLIGLTDRASPPEGEIDADVVARALADTDAAVDGYLAGRYQLPISETPALLADLAQAIAIYKLHPYAPDPKIEADYKDAIKTLRDIATGVVRLTLDGVEQAGSGASGVQTNDRERPLTAENMKGFI